MRIRVSIILIAVVLLSTSHPLSGKELPKIAVWDLVAGNITPSYAQDLTSILVSEITKLGKYEVYSQDIVRTLAGWTAERMQLGCTDTKCLTALGQMDIAKLISGRIGKIGNRYSVSLNLFDTQNAKAENAVSEFGRTEDELIDLVQVAVRKLLAAEVEPSQDRAQVGILKQQMEETRKIEEERKKLEAEKQALAKDRPLREPKSVPKTKPIEFSYSIFFPAPHENTVLAGEWAKEIERRTNGRVKIKLLPGGTLTPADKCYDGMVKGISDIGMSVLGYTRGKFPLTEVIDLPLGYKSGAEATRLVNRYYHQFKPKELDEVKVLYLHAHGPGILYTKKAVRKLEDLKGMRIRSTGLSAKVVSALGGVPVAMPVGETYDALQRGMVEGSIGPMESLEGWKWGELVKYTTESFGSAYSTAFFVAMNKEKWNALPTDVQAIIERINKEWAEKTGRLWDEIDKSSRAYTLNLGNQILPLSREENQRWANTVQPILDEYVSAMRPKGLPGEDALQFCLEELMKGQ